MIPIPIHSYLRDLSRELASAVTPHICSLFSHPTPSPTPSATISITYVIRHRLSSGRTTAYRQHSTPTAVYRNWAISPQDSQPYYRVLPTEIPPWANERALLYNHITTINTKVENVNKKATAQKEHISGSNGEISVNVFSPCRARLGSGYLEQF